MANMRCKTKGNTKPKGKPRVYFTCHPEDFDTCFDKLCSDIFKSHDCAVYYTEDMTVQIAEQDKQTDLERNNLFVIPVTRKLLTTPNRAMDEDLPYALEKHIPVLPIIMEAGLDELYAQPDKFGQLQYLNCHSTDETEISYEDKLKKYLDSVLISSRLATRIRAAFDAYIFLSYRKKDRRHANELMRLIHSHKECRDIAVWFDEFLTPGESFSENINKILKDSKLFALLVTPSLLEEPGGKPNFVMGEEYPAARRIGMDILPTEMEATDKAALGAKFEGIPECVDPHDEQAFRDRLLEAVSKIAVTANDGDPAHNYLIGLAYLEGIDVEVDRDRAVSLITCAAEDGLPEAMEKLIGMYTDGVGVDRDRQKVLNWSQRLAEHYFRKSFSDGLELNAPEAVAQLFENHKNPYWADTIRLFLLQADECLEDHTIKELYRLLTSFDICEYTLLLDACKEMQQHQADAQRMLAADILKKSADGTYPPYGPLFWYIPEYGLYAQLLTALEEMTDHAHFSKALALARDVCWIFGHYNTVSQITDSVDGSVLLGAASALSGVRLGLCELFCTGTTSFEGGTDIYPRCFNIREVKSFLETGCGVLDRMPQAFEDELGLYQHDMFSVLDGEWLGIVAAPYDIAALENTLIERSTRKLRGLFLSPTEETTMQYIAFNRRHVEVVYLPENTTKLSDDWKQYMPLIQDAVLLDNRILCFRDKAIIPDGLTQIEYKAFSGCTALSSVVLPDGITTLSASAFENCKSLTSIRLPNSLKSMESYVFRKCEKLTSITLPDSITMLSVSAFENCKSLTSIRLPNSLKSMESNVFCKCEKLTSITLPDSITTLSKFAFEGCTSLTSIKLPESIIEIADHAFSHCASLASITVPKDVTTIGAFAFEGCTALTSITLPQKLKSLGLSAFANCTSLQMIQNCPRGYFHKELGLPETVKIVYREEDLQSCVIDGEDPVIRRFKYAQRRNFDKLHIMRGVTHIEMGAFCYCTSLRSVTLSQGVITIGNAAFANCVSLSHIALPNSVMTIGADSFRGCISLSEVSLPENIKEIGRDAFTECTGMKRILNCPIEYTREYLGLSADVVIQYKEPTNPNGLKENSIINIKDGISEHKQDITSLQIPSDETHIRSFAFSEYTSLTSVILPCSVKAINDNAFENCTSLTSVTFTLPYSVLTIGKRAFRGCVLLPAIILPYSLEIIESFAFADCVSLTSISIPDNVKEIGPCAFRGCTSLAAVRLPKTIKEIEVCVFDACTALKSIVIPNSVTDIGIAAFCNCVSLTSVTLPENTKKICKDAFSGCISLATALLTDSITEIGEKAFYGCASLSAIIIPTSVRLIGDNAFGGCTGLKEISISRRFEGDLERIFSGVELSNVEIHWID